LQSIKNIGQQEQNNNNNPVSYAFKYLNSPETQRQYPRRIKLFLDHVGLIGGVFSPSLEAQGQAFLDNTRKNL
jgi:hypothetical protein